MISPELITSVKQGLSQGISQEALVAQMRASGWNEQDIQEVFIHIMETPVPVKETPSRLHKYKKLFFLVEILLLVVVFCVNRFYVGDYVSKVYSDDIGMNIQAYCQKVGTISCREDWETTYNQRKTDWHARSTVATVIVVFFSVYTLFFLVFMMLVKRNHKQTKNPVFIESVSSKTDIFLQKYNRYIYVGYFFILFLFLVFYSTTNLFSIGISHLMYMREHQIIQFVSAGVFILALLWYIVFIFRKKKESIWFYIVHFLLIVSSTVLLAFWGYSQAVSSFPGDYGPSLYQVWGLYVGALIFPIFFCASSFLMSLGKLKLSSKLNFFPFAFILSIVFFVLGNVVIVAFLFWLGLFYCVSRLGEQKKLLFFPLTIICLMFFLLFTDSELATQKSIKDCVSQGEGYSYLGDMGCVDLGVYPYTASSSIENTQGVPSVTKPVSISTMDLSHNPDLNQSDASANNAPRVMFWPGKVNQHWNTENHRFETDPLGFNDTADPLVYCKRFYPNTTKTEPYKKETSYTWAEAGNRNNWTGEVLSYLCFE